MTARPTSPSVIAATAGGKIAAAAPIAVCAATTTSIVGHQVEQHAASRNHRRRDRDRQPLPPDTVDQGAERGLGQHRPDLRCRQRDPDSPRIPVVMLAEKSPQERPHAVAHVGQKEIQAVERPQACRRRLPFLGIGLGIVASRPRSCSSTQ